MDIILEYAAFIGKAICHQLPERTFMVDGHHLPLCARCSGIYIGIFASILYLAMRGKFQSNTIPSIKYSLLLLISLLPLVIDGFSSYLGLYTTNNLIRVLTGVLFGVALPVFVVPLLTKSKKTNNPIMTKSNEFLIPLISATVLAIFTMMEFIPLLLLNILMIGTVICWGTLLFYLYFKRAERNTLSIGYSIVSSIITLIALSGLHSVIEPFLLK